MGDAEYGVSKLLEYCKTTPWIYSIPGRPSQKSGRKYIMGQVASATAAVDLVHAPALTQPIYIVDFILTGQNTGAAVSFTIQNYTIPMMPFLCPKGTAAAPAAFAISHTFTEPMPFPINIFLNPNGSTLTYSFAFTGYTE